LNLLEVIQNFIIFIVLSILKQTPNSVFLLTLSFIIERCINIFLYEKITQTIDFGSFVALVTPAQRFDIFLNPFVQTRLRTKQLFYFPLFNLDLFGFFDQSVHYCQKSTHLQIQVVYLALGVLLQLMG
jgi:hypothetical protein